MYDTRQLLSLNLPGSRAVGSGNLYETDFENATTSGSFLEKALLGHPVFQKGLDLRIKARILTRIHVVASQACVMQEQDVRWIM